ncbi:MAG: glycine cleavage system protein GcvH [bacterium]|nr:glycine cleavage system protein GcvH [bacterium]
MAETEYQFPDDCKYTEADEWVRVDGDTIKIGITDYAQSELSDIVFVELPDFGREVEEGEAFAVVESVKAVSDLFAPISGTVAEGNIDLDDHPEWINEDPYGRGWILTMTPKDPASLENLMSSEQYAAHVKARAGK